MSPNHLPAIRLARVARNKARTIGLKRLLLPRRVWSIGARPERAGDARDVGLFDTAIDRKLRGCALVGLWVGEGFAGGRIRECAHMIQSRAGKPVRCEIAQTARLCVEHWRRDIERIGLAFLWPTHIHGSPHGSTRQDARIV